MSLQVNLILPGEQRSANPVSFRSLSRIGSIVGPTVVVLLLAIAALNWSALTNKVRIAETIWQELEPKKEAAISLRARYDRNQQVLKELNGWKASRVLWHRQLEGLRDLVPPSMQLLSLRVDQQIQVIEKSGPARTFTLTLSGRAEGPDAQSDVLALQTALLTRDPFAGLTRNANVPAFDAAPENKAHRLFQIKAPYNPQPFQADETTGRQATTD